MIAGIRRAVGRLGYEIRKAPRSRFDAVSVFDLAIRYLMRECGESLVFLEVGANDGKAGDPLWDYIDKYRWTGVCVEPQPDVFERLKENHSGHPGIAFENVAISSSPHPLELYRPPASMTAHDPTARIASLSAKTTARQIGGKVSELEKILVPTLRLDDLVGKHGLQPLHLLQLDTEGFEWDVLQTLDLTKTRPYIIGFEHGHMTPAAIGDMTAHLNACGYDVSYGGHETDSVALRKDFLQ